LAESRSSTDVPFEDIPQTVLDDVQRGIHHYFAPLLLLSPEHPKKPVALGGSGTFVELDGKYYILTADHVWNNASKWPQLGLVLEAEGGGPLGIPIDRMAPPRRLAGHKYTEWGPDLALVELPAHLVSSIKARKSFLNLAKRRARFESHPPREDKASGSLWV
jgi:hypothetical protein